MGIHPRVVVGVVPEQQEVEDIDQAALGMHKPLEVP